MPPKGSMPPQDPAPPSDEDAPDAGADPGGDKPVHEHLRDLADEVEKRAAAKPPADAPGGDAPMGDDAPGAPGAGQDGAGVPMDGKMGDQPPVDGSAQPGADQPPGEDGAAGEFNPETVPVASHVAFSAGSFLGKGEVTAVGEDGCTVKDASGREHRIRWDEVTGMQGAGDEPPGEGDQPQEGAPPDGQPPAPGVPPQGGAATPGKKPPFGGAK